MKKIIVLLVSVLTLSACGASSSQSSQTAQNQQSTPPEIGRPDFGQPDRTPELMGIVKSITGNEVVLLELDMPNFGQKNQQDAATTDSKTTDSETPAVTPTLGGLGGGVPGGGPGMGGGMRRDTTDSASMIEALKSRSIGETTLIIPVGIRMLKPDTETKEMLEASLSDIKADQMLSIWLNPSVTDRQIAEFVLIR